MIEEKKGRILIIEDDKVDQLAYSRFVNRKKFAYDCTIGGSVKEAKEILKSQNFDAVVLDYILGDGTAFDLFDLLTGIPIIIVTGKGDEELAVQAMKEGAYDYLSKDVWGNHVTRLQITIDNALEKKRLEDLIILRTQELEKANKEIKKVNLQLKKLAVLDGLTGIPNYRRFAEVFQMEWRRAIRNKKPVSVILIDVDYFKFFNDSYGHQKGDECLKKIAQKLKKTCRRPADMAARYGGEEFIVVLSECDDQGAMTMAEKLRRTVEGLAIPHKKSKVAKIVTISLGCATIIPKKEIDSNDLIRAADEALYESKNKGRNCVTVAKAVTPLK